MAYIVLQRDITLYHQQSISKEKQKSFTKIATKVLNSLKLHIH